ncbi:MAG: hypothetical protein LBH80_05010 [Prevotellaceae bacterium]|nr:hypothetical protein [Prevotellaceae bacterium]
MKNLLTILIMSLLLVFLFSCRGSRKTTANTHQGNKNDTIVLISVSEQMMTQNLTASQGPPAIVYKTAADFSDYIPVIMNRKKTEIISYPAPSDIYYEGRLAKPTVLKNAYLLDNRGIDENVVFLNYTYEEYSLMDSAPTLSEMKNNIKEKYPLLEMLHCGVRHQYTDIVNELNELIDKGFPGCSVIYSRPQLKLSNMPTE